LAGCSFLVVFARFDKQSVASSVSPEIERIKREYEVDR